MQNFTEPNMIVINDAEQAPYKVKETVPLTTPRVHEIWVRATDDVHKLAADILDKVEDFDWVEAACIGAGCLNQATKAIAVARERLGKDKLDLIAQPYFSSFTDDQDRSRTRIILRLMLVDVVLA